jgi:hypothetical protein
VRKYLDCWPPTFPIIIKYHFLQHSPPHPADVDNIFVALDNSDRICSIELHATSLLLEKVSRVMRVPFPALKNLSFWPTDIGTPIISKSFLGGSAPGLQKITLRGKPSSALPKLLLSCRDLMELRLYVVSNPDDISPEVIVTSLSSLSRLKILQIVLGTQRPSRSIHLPPRPRSTLYSLSELTLSGSSEYLEDLISRIDTPFLQRIIIYSCHRLTDAPQLRQLICRTEGLRSPDQVKVIKNERGISLQSRQVGRPIGYPIVRYPPTMFKNISFSVLDWQISHVAQFFLRSRPLLCGVKRLIVDSTIEQARWQDPVSPVDWFDFFRPFSDVEELYVYRRLGSPVAFALASSAGQAKILPALRNVFFEGAEEFASAKETIKPFFTARRLSHRNISLWTKLELGN